jgi:hypothetical protein
MDYVIVNDAGLLYTGFDSEKGKPMWAKVKRPECVMTEAVADAVVRQLTQLGFTKFVKRASAGVIRKWVPSDTDATTLPHAPVQEEIPDAQEELS